MGALVKNGIIEEIDCGLNFAYVLNDNSLFLLTEYKVLQSQVDSVFIRCIKLLFNGKLELYYLVGDYKPLSEMFYSIGNERMATILNNLFSGIARVKSNGFLSCENIDISLNHIYVDPKTLSVRFVYLPLSKHEFRDANTFEDALKMSLIRSVSENALLSPMNKDKLIDRIHKGSTRVEATSVRIPPKTSPRTSYCYMKLVPMDQSENVIEVNKAEFTIGQLDTNDYVCKNKAISRQHCKIKWDGKQFAVYEWYGFRSNKTYVNGKALSEGEYRYLSNDDILQLANSKFKVVI